MEHGRRSTPCDVTVPSLRGHARPVGRPDARTLHRSALIHYVLAAEKQGGQPLTRAMRSPSSFARRSAWGMWRRFAIAGRRWWGAWASRACRCATCGTKAPINTKSPERRSRTSRSCSDTPAWRQPLAICGTSGDGWPCSPSIDSIRRGRRRRRPARSPRRRRRLRPCCRTDRGHIELAIHAGCGHRNENSIGADRWTEIRQNATCRMSRQESANPRKLLVRKRGLEPPPSCED